MDWDNLGFGLVPTDYMYSMKCSDYRKFEQGQLSRYGKIELSPSAGVLNYGQASCCFIYLIMFEVYCILKYHFLMLSDSKYFCLVMVCKLEFYRINMYNLVLNSDLS